MWFLGLIVGAVVGSIGSWGGAFVGAIVGLLAGLAMARPRPVVDEVWKNNIEAMLRQQRRQIEALERRAGATPEPKEAVPGPAVAAAQPAVEPSLPAETMAQASAPAGTGDEVPAPRVPARPVPVAGADDRPGAPMAPSAPSDNPFTQWLLGGNTLVRVGIVVLFFGVAFLLKYAAERDLVPIELRLTGVAMGGIALLVVGWVLRLKRPGYALMLQGGGVGVLYLTVFAAF